MMSPLFMSFSVGMPFLLYHVTWNPSSEGRFHNFFIHENLSHFSTQICFLPLELSMHVIFGFLTKLCYFASIHLLYYKQLEKARLCDFIYMYVCNYMYCIYM